MVNQSQFIEMFQHSPKVKIGDICDLINGDRSSHYPKGDDFVEYGIPFINAGHIQNDHVDFSKMDYITSEKFNELRSGHLEINDVIYCLRGSLGKHCIIKTVPAAIASSLVILRIKDPEIEPLFLDYSMSSYSVTEQMNMANNGSAQPNLSAASVSSFEIPHPQKEEQYRFVQIAQRADKSKFAGFKSQFISQFGFPQDGAEKYPSVTIESLLQETISGEWGTDCPDDSGTKVIRTTNFTNEGILDLTDVVVRTIDSKKVEKKQLKKGDIILEKSGGTKDNPVGRLVYFEEDGVYLANNFTQVLRPAVGINTRYLFAALFYLYQTHKPLIKGLGNQTNGIQNLKVPQYLQLLVSVPDREEQDAFERVMKQADKSKYLN